MNLLTHFEEYLTDTKKVSAKTLRNYRSDIGHFFKWAELHLQTRGIKMTSHTQLVANFSPSLIGQYKGFHLEANTPHATTNRRLSTLRNFSRFLVEQGFKNEDPTEVVENLKSPRNEQKEIEELIAEFKKHLTEENLSKSTLKNYVSDIKAFGNWLQSQKHDRTGWSQTN